MIKGISVGPQITQLLKDQDFNTKLNLAERRAWKAFEKSVCRNFLGNEKAENYTEIMQELISSYSAMWCNISLKLSSYSAMWCNISLKLLFLHSHMDFLPEYKAAASDEHGERFHPGISQI